MITLFTSLRTLPLGPEYDDERTLATLKLMEYLKATGRIEQYIECVLWTLVLSLSLSICVRACVEPSLTGYRVGCVLVVRYAYQLYERHLSANHLIEAGFTLLLQAQLLDWSDTIVPAIPSRQLPQETSYERRVRSLATS